MSIVGCKIICNTILSTVISRQCTAPHCIALHRKSIIFNEGSIQAVIKVYSSKPIPHHCLKSPHRFANSPRSKPILARPIQMNGRSRKLYNIHTAREITQLHSSGPATNLLSACFSPPPFYRTLHCILPVYSILKFKFLLFLDLPYTLK